jgi:hypothetical protein
VVVFLDVRVADDLRDFERIDAFDTLVLDVFVVLPACDCFIDLPPLDFFVSALD